MAKTASSPTASAPAAAPAAAPAGLSFEDAAVPEVTREPKANPFAEVAKTLAENKGNSATAFTVANEDVAYNIRLAQNAGKAVGVTIRNKREAVGDDKTKVTIWAVDAIHRPRQK